MKINIKEMMSLAKKIQRRTPRFYLAGGTALMFKYNHRQSIDLDFFSEKSFSFNILSNKLRKIFKIENETRGDDNIDFFINKIKISFVFFPFKNIDEITDFSGIYIASDYDLFLNKIYVAGRRIDPKDPFDVSFLYDKHNWNKHKIQTDFETKFPNQSYKIYLGAILSFDDYPELDNKTKETLIKLI